MAKTAMLLLSVAAAADTTTKATTTMASTAAPATGNATATGNGTAPMLGSAGMGAGMGSSQITIVQSQKKNCDMGKHSVELTDFFSRKQFGFTDCVSREALPCNNLLTIKASTTSQTQMWVNLAATMSSKFGLCWSTSGRDGNYGSLTMKPMPPCVAGYKMESSPLTGAYKCTYMPDWCQNAALPGCMKCSPNPTVAPSCKKCQDGLTKMGEKWGKQCYPTNLMSNGVVDEAAYDKATATATGKVAGAMKAFGVSEGHTEMTSKLTTTMKSLGVSPPPMLGSSGAMNATAPNATAPNATAPNATAPKATEAKVVLV